MNEPSFEPDIDDVLQREDTDIAEPTVTVCVEGPVRTQALPRKSNGIMGIPLSATAARRLLTADPSRASATVTTLDTPIWLAGSKQEAEGGRPAPMPPNQVLILDAADEVWAMAQGADTVIGLIQSRWADG